MDLTKLDEKFNKAFAKTFADLNLHIFKTEKQKENGVEFFEAATPVLGEGGCTVSIGNNEHFKLAPAAKAMYDVKRVKPFITVYRIEFTEDDAARAIESDAYFKHLFVPMINEAIRRYIMTFGQPDETRFGRYFCNPTSTNEFGIFIYTASGNIELRLTGEWASNQPIEGTTDERKGKEI